MELCITEFTNHVCWTVYVLRLGLIRSSLVSYSQLVSTYEIRLMRGDLRSTAGDTDPIGVVDLN
jgi:hypothetical protein